MYLPYTYVILVRVYTQTHACKAIYILAYTHTHLSIDNRHTDNSAGTDQFIDFLADQLVGD